MLCDSLSCVSHFLVDLDSNTFSLLESKGSTWLGFDPLYLLRGWHITDIHLMFMVQLWNETDILYKGHMVLVQ